MLRHEAGCRPRGSSGSTVPADGVISDPPELSEEKHVRKTTNRRLASVAVGAMVMPLVLTACSSSSNSGSSGGGGAQAQCGSGAGVGKAAGGTIKIGFQG